MRTPFDRPICALSIAVVLVACSGTTTSPAPTTATAVPSPNAASTATAVPPPSTTAVAAEVGRAGLLSPGTYGYSQHDPAVTFDVPTGWLLTEAMPMHFGLRPTEFIADDSVKVWYDMRVASRDPSCPEEPEPAVGHDALQFTYQLRHRPGVVPTRAIPITLGGLDGHWFDLRIDESWTEPCPFTDGVPSTTLFTDDFVPDDPAFWGLSGYDERMRLIVLDDGAGSNIVVTIDAMDPPAFEALVTAAMPVIDTFRFEEPQR